MRNSPPGRVEDYTGTCLVFFFINLFWILVAVMVNFGWPVVLLLAAALHAMIGWLEGQREAEDSALAPVPGVRD